MYCNIFVKIKLFTHLGCLWDIWYQLQIKDLVMYELWIASFYN